MLQVLTTQDHQTSSPPKLPPSARILVVDDEPDLKRMTATILERAGYLVETAAEGGQAWELIKKESFTLWSPIIT